MDRCQSLRTKLPLLNLHRKRGKLDDSASLTVHGIVDSETLQVKDMDFELVCPNIGRFEATPASEDSSVLGHKVVNPTFSDRRSIPTSLLSLVRKRLPIRSPLWMHTSRTIKKVKKLLLNDVPSSVPYRKARVVPDIYSKLGQRGRVPALSDIERDTKLYLHYSTAACTWHRKACPFSTSSIFDYTMPFCPMTASAHITFTGNLACSKYSKCVLVD
ncbi:hypothetical protein BDQ17DRAFT_1436335 [Cyathus striatus]|nr:hypothetical protein BDQ17DRAFT_1436335 [Cyathus striatus]